MRVKNLILASYGLPVVEPEEVIIPDEEVIEEPEEEETIIW